MGPRVSKLDNLAAFRWFFASLGRHNTDQTKSWHEWKSAPIYAEVYTVGHADFGRCSRFLIKQSIAGVFAYSRIQSICIVLCPFFRSVFLYLRVISGRKRPCCEN